MFGCKCFDYAAVTLAGENLYTTSVDGRNRMRQQSSDDGW
jgi:hypothetical protein